ncbi:MAG: PQQ-binding-like beta-propeller repeat protein [Minisyncoccia bacterium]
MNDSDARVSAFRDVIAKRVRVYAKDEHIVQIERGGPQDAAWIFDFRRIMLEAEWLDRYAELFWERFANHTPFQVGGMETAAIPLVAAIVMKSKQRGTPVNGFYIRKSRDKDGLMRQIEGTLSDEPIILVDDIINSGNSFLKQVEVLATNGKRVAHVFALLAFRPLDAYHLLTKRNIHVSHIFSLHEFGVALPTGEQAPRELFETMWKFAARDPGFEYVVPKSAPLLDETHMYFGSDDGVFRALDQATGTPVWEFTTGAHPKHKGIFSSPTLHKGVVYFGAYDGNVYALDAKTGAKRWANTDADWIGSSPALAPEKNLLFIGLEFGLFRKLGGVAAIDMQTGKTRWSDRTTQFTHGSPLYIQEENLVVVGSNDYVAYAHDADTGVRKWTYQTAGEIKARPAYDAERRLILVPSLGGPLYAFSAKGEIRWAFSSGGFYSNPLVRGSVVYAASVDKSLYCLDLTTGKKKWSFGTKGRIFASPVIADDSLWIGSNDGQLYELDPESGHLKGSHLFTERIVNAIAYNETTRHFFVPTVANELYALKRNSPAIQ